MAARAGDASVQQLRAQLRAREAGCAAAQLRAEDAERARGAAEAALEVGTAGVGQGQCSTGVCVLPGQPCRLRSWCDASAHTGACRGLGPAASVRARRRCSGGRRTTCRSLARAVRALRRRSLPSRAPQHHARPDTPPIGLSQGCRFLCRGTNRCGVGRMPVVCRECCDECLLELVWSSSYAAACGRSAQPAGMPSPAGFPLRLPALACTDFRASVCHPRGVRLAGVLLSLVWMPAPRVHTLLLKNCVVVTTAPAQGGAAARGGRARGGPARAGRPARRI